MPHPYTIQFDLSDVPRGLITLKVSLLVETPRAPRLEVGINGHQALYYRHPRLNYTGGDRQMVVSPIASEDTIIAEINPAYLEKGTNKLVLTAIDELPGRDDVTGSGIFYDALELNLDAKAVFNKSKVTAEVAPTVFHEQKGEALTELVDVHVTSNQPFAHGQLTLKFGNQKFSKELSSQRDFGEAMAEFAVPEFAPGTAGEATTRIGGKTQRFPVTLNPAKKWTIYVVPNEHLDVG